VRFFRRQIIKVHFGRHPVGRSCILTTCPSHKSVYALRDLDGLRTMAAGHGHALDLSDRLKRFLRFRASVMPHLAKTGGWIGHCSPGSVPTLSQLCPNNGVPERPAESQWIRLRSSTRTVTRTDWDWAGPSETQREPADLSDNAEVAGSIPASPQLAPHIRPCQAGGVLERTVVKTFVCPNHLRQPVGLT
jgi:hypothetical protein